MVLNNRTNTNSPYAHSGSLTREQFLFFEMRTTAKLMIEGLTDEEIYERIYSENLFQFPTEKSIKLITSGCIRRLMALNNEKLVEALATHPTDEAKQISGRGRKIQIKRYVVRKDGSKRFSNAVARTG